MVRRPLSLIALFFLFTTLILLRLYPIRGNPPDIPEGRAVTISGRLKDKQQKNGSFILTLSHADPSDLPHNAGSGKASVLVYLKDDKGSLSDLPPMGSLLMVRGEFSLIPEATNPGQFDQKTYYLIRGIEYRLFKGKILSKGKRYDLLRENLFKLRLSLSGVYEKLLNDRDSGVLKAMLLGDRNDLDPEIKDLYRESGIAHALSISGLHISILGYGLFKLLKMISSNRYISAAASGSFVFLYSVMVGGSTSTVRAFIMFSTCMGAEIFNRTYDLLSALSLSLMVILLSDPYYILDPGFALSFGAVLGIAVLTPAMREALPFSKTGIVSSLAAGLSVFLAILPVNLWFCYEVPVYSVFLNLLIVPLMGILVVSGVIVAVSGVILLPAGMPGAYICHIILKIYERGCLFIRGFPHSRMISGRPEPERILIYYLFLLLFLISKKSKKSLILLFLIPLILLIRPHNALNYTMLDIGQGDCNVIDSRGKVIMIDCGSTSEKEIGKYKVIPFLKYSGLSGIDAVIVTHTDLDHINGVFELMDLMEDSGIRIKNLVMPGLKKRDEKYESLIHKAKEAGITVSTINGGQEFNLGGMRFCCLSPDQGFDPGDPNSGSVVLKGVYGDLKFLFTGDVVGEGEEEMMKKLIPGERINVLKTAHHGSGYSTPEEFLSITRPETALISAGKNNRYGHPHKELLNRLERAGSRVFVTARSGAITVRSGKTGYSIKCFKEE